MPTKGWSYGSTQEGGKEAYKSGDKSRMGPKTKGKTVPYSKHYPEVVNTNDIKKAPYGK